MRSSATPVLVLALALAAACCGAHARPQPAHAALPGQRTALGEAVTVGGAVGEALTTTKAASTKAVRTSGRVLSEECVDLADNCAELADSCGPDYVDTEQELPIGEYWCPATCGICELRDTTDTDTSDDYQESPDTGSDDYQESPDAGSDDYEESPATDTNSGDDSGEDSGSGWEAELLSLVNAARAEAGAPALCLNSKLIAAAQAHSEDQAGRQSMGHDGSDGSDIGDRLTAAGYAWTAAGENVASGQPDVQSVFESWMGSEGHRANILSADFTHMGAGRADSDSTYWTQTFGGSDSESCA